MKMMYCIKNKEVLEALAEIFKMKEQAKQVWIREKIREKDSHYYANKLFQPKRKAVTDAAEKLFEETKSTRKAVEEL